MTTYININGDVREASSLKVPADRTFRAAWQFEGEAVEVDMKAAKGIWRDKIRQARNPEFEKLDVEFMRMLEQGDTDAQKALSKVKQELRDTTKDPRIKEATTPEELVKVQPIPNVKVE